MKTPLLAAAESAVPNVAWGLIAPVWIPAVAMLAVLLLDAVHPRRSGRAVWAVAVLGVLGAAGAVVRLAMTAHDQKWATRSTFCVPVNDVETCAYVSSSLTLSLQAVLVASALVSLLLARDGSDAQDGAVHNALFLAATTGALALAGSRDLITLLIALETASLPVVALIALRRDAPGAQAAVTLLLTAIASSAIFLLGAGLLLLGTGSLHLPTIGAVLAAQLDPSHTVLTSVGVLVIVAGLAYKISAVPFQFWTPDVYAGTPLPVAAFLTTVSKGAALTAIIVVLIVGAPALADVWAPVIGVVAVLTMTVGNLVALRQRVAVRLLAWSTVAQAGWILLPLAGLRWQAQTPGFANPWLLSARTASAAAVAYLAAYAAASLAAFSVVTITARHLSRPEEHTLAAYRGLARREPFAAAVLAFALISLAGLPPGLAGLMAKVLAVRPVVDSRLWLLAVMAAVNVAIGLVYYLRWAALLVSEPAPGQTIPSWRLRPAEGLALGLAGGAVLALSLLPQALAVLVPAGLG